MNTRASKYGFVAATLAALLAGCGGGGADSTLPAGDSTASTESSAGANTGGGAPSSPTPAPAPGPVPAPAPAPGPAPAPAPAPSNDLTAGADDPTYAQDSEARKAFSVLNYFRSMMGVGALTQNAALDGVAFAHNGFVVAAGGPDGSASQQQDARTRAAAAGFPVSGTGSYDTRAITDSFAGHYCVKALFSSVYDIEWLSSGMRSVGMAMPDAPGVCAVTTGIADVAGVQLPAAGNIAAYPYPGKVETLRTYEGFIDEPGLAKPLGHPVFVSVASKEASPFTTSGASALGAGDVTLMAFSMSTGGTPVAAKVLAHASVSFGAVADAQAGKLALPTSFALVPTAPLQPLTTYDVTFRAIVKGRELVKSWSFTTR